MFDIQQTNTTNQINTNLSEPNSDKWSQIYCTLQHILLLLKKNFLINKRHKYLLIFHYTTPLIVFLLLIFWQHIANNLTMFIQYEPPIHSNPKIPKCISPEYIDSLDENDDNCITVGYHIIGSKQIWVDDVMKYVAFQNNLIFGKDVKQISEGSFSELNKYITNNLNRTQIGVIFCTDYYPIEYEDVEIRVPCNLNLFSPYLGYFQQSSQIKSFAYTILFNNTLNYKSAFLTDPKQAVIKEDLVLALKVSLDNAIIEIVENNAFEDYSKIKSDKPLKIDFQKSKMEVSIQDFPKFPTRFMVGFDLFSSYGAFYLFIPIMISFILLINEILREKEKKLRQGITTIGLSQFSYISSWVIYSCISMAILQFVMVVLGYLFRFDFFVKCPLIIIFMVFFCFGLSILSIAYLITTICENVQLGYTVGYGFLLLAIVMEMFMSSPIFIYFLYQNQPNFFVSALVHSLSLYPPFHYSKIFQDIAQKTTSHFDITNSKWSEGKGFGYNDIFETVKGKFQFPPVTYETPTLLQSFIYMNLSTFVIFILSLYFDHVMPSNRGTSESPLFFLTQSYWSHLFQQKQTKQCHQNQKHLDFDYSIQIDQNINTVSLEKERVLKNHNQQAIVKGIRIISLSKTYQKPFCLGFKPKKGVQALKDIQFEIDDGELIALLGQNGAGKSTLIGILTGLLNPTSGTAFVCNYDIRYDMDEIKKLIGVCPQFDILWDELTAQEHLEMYSKIKNVRKENIQQEIDNRLLEVKMLDRKNQRVGTFSGGQKRRISLAIACIGNPKIIILDEPTTGMDPKIRREVWDMIKTIKQGRSVILTTHAMEEADVLSDRIIVLAEGEVKALGTSLFLKNNFGNGYTLTIDVTERCDKQAILFIKQFLPDCNVISSTAGNIIIGTDKIDQIKQFYRFIEEENLDENEELNIFKQNIKNLSLSHSTLEQVFTKITNK